MRETPGTNKRQLRNYTTLQVLLAIVAAIVLGNLDPNLALATMPLGDHSSSLSAWRLLSLYFSNLDLVSTLSRRGLPQGLHCLCPIRVRSFHFSSS